MCLDKRRLLMKAYIQSQFNYCPLVWMIHSRNLNNKINKIHERALRIVYEDYNSKFEELLKRDNSVTIHQKNLQYLAIEIYKVKRDLSPKIMKDLFQFNENPAYRLRSGSHLQSRNSRTVFFGTESVVNLGAKIWNLVPKDIKDSPTLNVFKGKIKKWIPEKCPCRLCKIYINQVGFIN